MRVRWTDAQEYIGKRAAISGKIVHIGHARAIHFLEFSRTDRDAFKLVVFDRTMEQFTAPLEELYQDQIIEVTGNITVYDGNPQIVIARPSQIEVLDELPDISQPAVQRRKRKKSNTFKLATFNVKNLFDAEDDPYHADESTPAKPRNELDRVASVISELDADILALQEVEDRGYLERFVEALLPDLDYRHLVHFDGNDLRGIDVCLASRLPIGAVTSHRHLSFRDQNNVPRRFSRDLLQVEVLPEGGETFEVWVVHLKSNHGGREKAEPIRLSESNKIREMIDRDLSGDPQARFVICGDFNDTYDSPTLQTIVGRGDRSLVCFRDDLPDPNAFTFNRDPYLSMIDFILCSPAMARNYQPQSYQVRVSTLDESGSDHNPVSARFFFRSSDVPRSEVEGSSVRLNTPAEEGQDGLVIDGSNALEPAPAAQTQSDGLAPATQGRDSSLSQADASNEVTSNQGVSRTGWIAWGLVLILVGWGGYMLIQRRESAKIAS